MSDRGQGSPYILTRQIAGNTTGFWSVPGEVVAVERWTETTVSSSDGHVLVSGQHVSVTPPKAWADLRNRKAIWVRTKDSEFEVAVPEGTSVRVGHKVDVVASTVVGRNAGQWSALVNHGTGSWNQVDRLPPGGCYDMWTDFVMGFGQGSGNVGVGVMLLYAVLLGFLGLLTGSWAGAILGFVVGMVVGFCHALVGIFMGRNAMSRHAAAVREAYQLVLK